MVEWTSIPYSHHKTMSAAQKMKNELLEFGDAGVVRIKKVGREFAVFRGFK